MGYIDYSAADWKSYAEAHITGRTSVSGTNGLFSATKMADDMNPKNIVIRESRDSENHPNSTPIIIALDVTGSMGPVLRSVVENLNTLMTEIYERKPVGDPPRFALWQLGMLRVVTRHLCKCRSLNRISVLRSVCRRFISRSAVARMNLNPIPCLGTLLSTMYLPMLLRSTTERVSCLQWETKLCPVC